MNKSFSNEKMIQLVKLIRKISKNRAFTILEVGALPLDG
jgi:hypothetical protein